MPAQPLLSKEYETIYVLRSDVDSEAAEKVQSRVAEVLDREQGKLIKLETWGRRKLAYPVQKQRKGVYVYAKYVARGGAVTELERNLKLQDAVLKFQTVLLRSNVDVGTLEIDPEEATLRKVDLTPDTDEPESIEKLLGLVDGPSEGRGERRDRDVEDDDMADAGEAEGRDTDGNE
jgi:small subunit ribosomal protein S6